MHVSDVRLTKLGLSVCADISVSHWSERASPARAEASLCTVIRMAGVCNRTENTMLLTSGSGDYLEYARFLMMIAKFLPHSSFKPVSESLFSIIRPPP